MCKVGLLHTMYQAPLVGQREHMLLKPPGYVEELAQQRVGSHSQSFWLKFLTGLSSCKCCPNASVRREETALATTLIKYML